MQHPGWEEWVAEAQREIERLRKRASRRALAHEGANQRELDYIRGWIDALRWTYRMPESAERELEKFVRELEAEDAGRAA